MIRGLKISQKLLLFFLLTALTPLTIAGLMTYQSSVTTVEGEIMSNLMAQADQRGEEILRHIADRKKLVDTLSRNPLVASALHDYTQAFAEGLDSAAYQLAEQKFSLFFSDLIDSSGFYDLFLISVKEDIIFSVAHEQDFGTNLTSGPYHASGLAEVVDAAQTLMSSELSKFTLYAPSGKEAAFFAVPVFEQDEYLGMIAVQMSLEPLKMFVDNYTSLGASGEIELAAADGDAANLLTPLRHDPETTSIKIRGLAGSSSLIGRALSKENGRGRVLDYRNIPVIAAWRYLPGLDWGLVVKIDADEAFAGVTEMNHRFLQMAGATVIAVILMALLLARAFAAPLKKLIQGTNQLAAGDLRARVQIDDSDEFGTLGETFNHMATQLQESVAKTTQENWLKQGALGLDDILRQTQDLKGLATGALTYLAEYLAAPVGTIYLNDGKDHFSLAAGYASQPSESTLNHSSPGPGLVEQAVRDRKKILLDRLPPGYLKISSSLGEIGPQSVLLLPIFFGSQVIAIMELGKLNPFDDSQQRLLDTINLPLGISIKAAMARQELSQSLTHAQQLAEELQAQQEELRVSNEELEEQTQQLQASEEELRNQQDELQAANEELEEKSFAMDEQQKRLIDRNNELLNIRQHLEQQARKLEQASRYKSEFLANMSHELRTPLNSLLILSQDLASNRKGNLLPEQVESAQIVFNSGNDLLKLINEILDLAKIESGTMSLAVDKVEIADIAHRLRNNFAHIAAEHQLDFTISCDSDLPRTIKTDPARLDQILKNLVSNALKFTEEGGVTVQFSVSNRTQGAIKITVTDTGIGMPQGSLEDIFTAFQQIDGSTSRKFNGTGLGLSISRELTQLLGGELSVSSELGSGSTFTLDLPPYAGEPEKTSAPPRIKTAPTLKAAPLPPHTPAPALPDGRNDLQPADKSILIIEDDLTFAKILADLCQSRGFKFLHAGDGETGLALIEQYAPSAIVLDMKLPGIQGLEVLDIIKGNPNIRHIPVHIMSATKNTGDAIHHGAVGFLQKPTDLQQIGQVFNKIEEMISGKIRRLLIVEDNPEQQKSIQTLIGDEDVLTTLASTGQAALEILATEQVDCMILDLNLPDISGFEVLERLNAQPDGSVPPVIIYSAKELTREETEALSAHADSIIIKGVQSPDRLLDEASLFLHRVVSHLPEHKQKMINSLYEPDQAFRGKKILLTDDDMRNVFAIAKILEDKGMEVFKAANGQKALDLLAANPKIDLILMDMMMPVMDGIEAIQKIRTQAQFSTVPIIALTAKAMAADRENCIAAGANDYMSKPVDINRLLSLMRVWLYRN